MPLFSVHCLLFTFLKEGAYVTSRNKRVRPYWAALKIILETPELEMVAINDLVPTDNLAYMLKYDSVNGRSPLRLETAVSHNHTFQIPPPYAPHPVAVIGFYLPQLAEINIPRHADAAKTGLVVILGGGRYPLISSYCQAGWV